MQPPQAPGVSPFTLIRYLFSRSYEVILPSSLTRVISRTLVFSTCLPVSVYGTGTNSFTTRFFRATGYQSLQGRSPSSSLLSIISADLPTETTYKLKLAFPSASQPNLLRHPLVSLATISGTGISTCCPSITPLDLILGPD